MWDLAESPHRGVEENDPGFGCCVDVIKAVFDHCPIASVTCFWRAYDFDLVFSTVFPWPRRRSSAVSRFTSNVLKRIIRYEELAETGTSTTTKLKTVRVQFRRVAFDVLNGRRKLGSWDVAVIKT